MWGVRLQCLGGIDLVHQVCTWVRCRCIGQGEGRRGSVIWLVLEGLSAGYVVRGVSGECVGECVCGCVGECVGVGV